VSRYRYMPKAPESLQDALRKLASALEMLIKQHEEAKERRLRHVHNPRLAVMVDTPSEMRGEAARLRAEAETAAAREAKEDAECSRCGGSIPEGSVCYLMGGGRYHPKCCEAERREMAKEAERLEEEADRLEKRLNSNPSPLVNPLLNALTDMGELSPEEAYSKMFEVRARVAERLGISTVLSCDWLIPWSRRVASIVEYLYRMILVYSEEIRSKYQEMVTIPAEAKRWLEKLYMALVEGRGMLTMDQYHDLVGKALFFTQQCVHVARHLADYHEFVAHGAVAVRGRATYEWMEEEKRVRPPEREEGE